MKARNRKTGEVVRGTFGRREGKAVLILENGKIVDAHEFKIVESAGRETSREEEFALREWLRNNPDCVDRGSDETSEDEEEEY